MKIDIVQAGWAVMGLGLLGVFVALVLIFIFAKILLAINRKWPAKSED